MGIELASGTWQSVPSEGLPMGRSGFAAGTTSGRAAWPGAAAGAELGLIVGMVVGAVKGFRASLANR